MRIFLTGGTGFIGQRLTKALVAQGWDVVALVRKPNAPQACALTQFGAQCVRGDVTDRGSMSVPMGDADVVIHNAGHYEFGLNAAGKRRMQAVNVGGTDNVLGLALALGVRRVIYVSTVLALGDSGPRIRDETFERVSPCRTTYERTKTEAHAIAREYQRRGLPMVIICPNAVIGANDHSVFGYFLRLYVNRMMPPMAWCPKTMFSAVEVDDLARGITLAVDRARPGETYFFAGEPKSFREHFGIWAKKPGAFRVRVWLPPSLMRLAFWPLESLQRAAGLPAFMSRETVSAGATNLYYASEKAKQELGWTHRTAEEMWFKTVEGELELLQKRKKRDLVSRLNPVEGDGE